MKIALAGNPNSGKTTLFNAVTGSNEKVGNWAGVTVDKKESRVKKSFYHGKEPIVAVDLPGAYSMSPFTSEESVTSTYVKNENPDVIINIVDSTNLSRSLFFATQLLELGIPTVIALNKTDINQKKNITIDTTLLSELLECPVIETVSTSKRGLSEVISTAVSLVGKGQKVPYVQPETDLSDRASVQRADRKRFEFVNKIVESVEKRSTLFTEKTIHDKADAILTNKWLGIPLFAIVMACVFFLSQHQNGPGVMIADMLTGLIEKFGTAVDGWMEGGNSEFIRTLVSSAIIDGVGAVIGFLPLVMVMYFLIALLEDCGYMARASVVLDPIFKKVGLSGKSVIPFVIGTGCAVPGVMACRTIRDERERRATAMLAPFMPCGAKLPVIALFVGAFFPNASWLSTAMYFVGILVILLCAVLVNKITGFRGRKSFFIIELPEYKIPSLKRAAGSMLSRGWSYIVKAGTVILVCNVGVTLMSSFTPTFAPVAQDGGAADSILAAISKPLDVLFVPIIGIASWKLVACAITGFIAKENVVGTIATVFSIVAMEDGVDLATSGSGIADALGIAPVAALAYMMFNLFSPPCFAAIGAMNSELQSKKWLFGAISLQIGVGYAIAFVVYQVGTLITTGSVGAGFLPGLVAIAVMLAIAFAVGRRNRIPS